MNTNFKACKNVQKYYFMFGTKLKLKIKVEYQYRYFMFGPELEIKEKYSCRAIIEN